tara:strand:+ start:196 stop:1209 length:1014 start_codon:yes stop_codon:yes gene_type:complete
MPAGVWNVDKTPWGGGKRVTPQLLRHYGIGSGFFSNVGTGAERLGYGAGYVGGWGGDGGKGDPSKPSTDYHLAGYKPWTDWLGEGGLDKYQDAIKRYQDITSQITKIPQVGSEEDLARLTDLHDQAKALQIEAREYYDKGRSLQDDYIKQWLSGHDITYDPTKEVGQGRYDWDRSTKAGRRAASKDYEWGDDISHIDLWTKNPHWDYYHFRQMEERGAHGGGYQKYDTPVSYKGPQQRHKWDEHALGALQRFKLKPPPPPPPIPKDPAVDKTTTANEYGSTTVDPMPDMDWFTESPRGAQGVSTQRGLTGRKKGGKYGKSFKRGDRENSLTTDSLNI